MTGKQTSTATALRHLADAGITTGTVAAEVGVTVRTVTRWACGTQQPRKANAAALRELVDDLLGRAVAGNTVCDGRQAECLRAAHAAITPTTPGTGRDAFAEGLRALLAPLYGAGRPAEPYLDARVHRAPHRPVTTMVDPFVLVPDPLGDKLDAAFGTPTAA